MTPPHQPVPFLGPCGNCARPDDDLTPVRRVYLESTGAGVREILDDEVERWCGSCRSQYHHRPATES